MCIRDSYDVVPADEDAWEKPPFEGIIEGGVLWGRGTLDTKGTLLGVMEAAEAMIARGFVPEHDIYLAFAGDEEIAGTGAPTTVKLLKARGVHAALVVEMCIRDSVKSALHCASYSGAARSGASGLGRARLSSAGRSR